MYHGEWSPSGKSRGLNHWGLRPLGFWPWDFPRDSIHHDTPLAFPHIVTLVYYYIYYTSNFTRLHNFGLMIKILAFLIQSFSPHKLFSIQICARMSEVSSPGTPNTTPQGGGFQVLCSVLCHVSGVMCQLFFTLLFSSFLDKVEELVG